MFTKLTVLGISTFAFVGLLLALVKPLPAEAQVTPSKPCGISIGTQSIGTVSGNGTANALISGHGFSYSCSTGQTSGCGYCVLAQAASAQTANGTYTTVAGSSSTFRSGLRSCGINALVTFDTTLSNMKPNTYYRVAVLFGPYVNGNCSTNFNDFDVNSSYPTNGPIINWTRFFGPGGDLR